MKRVVLACALVFLYLPATPARSASFNCTKSSAEVERMICADAQLSALDDELAETYRVAMKKMGQERGTRLGGNQIAWLKSRDACKDRLCVETMYRTRRAMLTVAMSAREPVLDRAPRPWSYGKFWLTYGQGSKVCEAYLERLNRGKYEFHPKCDRPDYDAVAGFRSLNRMKLSTEEVQPFWASLSTFLASGQIQDWRRGDEESRKLGLRPKFGSVEEQLKAIRSESTLGALGYGPIDLDNDGVADSVVIWRTGSCGHFGPIDKMFYWDSIPVVLNAARDGPDVERTRQLFGHPSGGYRLSSGKMASEFRPIGRSMGIFQFEGTYYMDTFFDAWGDFNGNLRDAPSSGQPVPAKDPEIANSLAVFLRREKETRQVCEYWFEDYSESRRETVP